MPVGHLLRFSSEVIAGMISNYCHIVHKGYIYALFTPWVHTGCIYIFTNCDEIISEITIAVAHSASIAIILFIAHIVNSAGSLEVRIHPRRRKLVWRFCAIIVE